MLRLVQRIPLSLVGDDDGATLLSILARIARNAVTGDDAVLRMLYQVLNFLTLQQLDQLGQKVPELMGDPAFLRSLMSRKFATARDEESRSLLSHEQKVDLLRELLAWVDEVQRAQPSAVVTLRAVRLQLMSELLQLGAELNRFDKDTLLRYCREIGDPAPSGPTHRSMPESPFFCAPEKVSIRRLLLEQPAVRAHLRAFLSGDAASADDFWAAVLPLLTAQAAGSGHLENAKVFRDFRDEVALLCGQQLRHPRVDAGWVEDRGTNQG